MFFLKAQWELIGLKAPAFSWIVSAVLIAYCAHVYVAHRKEAMNRRRALNIAERRLRFLQDQDGEPGQGISRRVYDSISVAFSDLPLLQTVWQSISALIIVRADKNGEDRFWLSEETGDIIKSTSMADSRSYGAAPAVISGVGLLATFLAILVALLDVRLASNRVQGLDLLVQGLSGKFLSSVVALSCATLLIYAEKGVSRPVLEAVTSFAGTLRNLVPRLAQAQILSNLQADIAEQSKMFRAFGADLAGNLKQGFESLEPSMRGMTAAVGNLNRVLEAGQAAKRESVEERLAPMLRDFGESLRLSLERMADRFNGSLAAGVQRQFAEISESLSNAVASLQQMNGQLSLSQNAFNDLIDVARNTTAEEVAGRHAQIEQLTAVVGELMVKLQEKTGESMGSMEKALTAITYNMSNKVMDLSTQMAAIVEETSERSASKAKEVLDQAGALSSRSAQQLVQLLERHSAELTKVEDLRTLLDSTIKGFVVSISKYDEVTEGLRKLASQMNIGVASMNQIARSTRESQEAAVKVAQSTSSQVELARDVAQSQKEVWNRVQASMVEYERVFERVESHARGLLAEIADHLNDYSGVTQKHFHELTSAADNFISQAVGRLASSTGELGEQLDDLQSAVANIALTSRAA